MTYKKGLNTHMHLDGVTDKNPKEYIDIDLITTDKQRHTDVQSYVVSSTSVNQSR